MKPILGSNAKVVKEGNRHKHHVQFLLGKGMMNVLRGVIGYFVRDPALIFRALVMQKY